MNLKAQRVLVLGLGVTGAAVLNAIVPRGASAFAYDDKDESVRSMLPELTRLGVPAITRDEAAAGEFDLCIVTPGVLPGNTLVEALSGRGIPVVSEIELAGRLAACPIAAITGTNGKSTTTVLAGLMLRESGIRCGIGGNLSAEGYDMPLITAVVESPDNECLCAEVSSAQLEHCFEFRPKVAALLNLTPDHLNRYRDLDEYAAAKMRIFQAQDESDVAVLGLDDPVASRVGQGVRAGKLWFSAERQPEQGAFLHGDSLVLRCGGREHVICRTDEMRLWARYDWLNALAAACIASAMGASIDGIRRAATTFPGLADRMEHCATINGVYWINSSMCTNPAAGAAAIRAVAERFRPIVIAGGSEKNLDNTDWGRQAAQHAAMLLLIGSGASDLEAAAMRAGARDVRRFGTLPEAMDAARLAARPGDAVILAPAMASFGEFNDFRERGRAFRNTVRSYQEEEK